MRFLIAFLLLASTAVAQTATRSYTGVDMNRYASVAVSAVMDATGEKLAYVNVSVPRSGTITKVGIRLGTVTEEDTLSVSLQTVGTDGKPSGSNYGSSTAGTVTFADTDDNTTQEVTLGTPATAVVGNVIAVVIAWNSYADGNLQINSAGSGGGNVNVIPTTYHNSGAGYVRTSGSPMLYLYYSDDGGEYRIPLGCIPPCAIAQLAIQSDTTPDEVSMKFTAPFDMRLNGVMWGALSEAGSTATVTFNLFSNAATPLSLLTNTTVFTHDGFPAAQAAVIGTEPESLTASQSVYCSIFSEDATNNFSVTYMDVSNVLHWGDFAPHIGWASRTRTTDGSPNGGPEWTDLSTRKPIGGVFFDQVTTSGGGSNVVDPLSGTIPGL